MGPPDAAERRPRQGTAPQIASDLAKDRYGNGTPDEGGAAYETDLFGEPVEASEQQIPQKIPPRGTGAYWSYINSLSLPDDLKFLDLAPEPGLAGVPRDDRRFVEAIWCQNADRYDHLLLIDIRTGRRYER